MGPLSNSGGSAAGLERVRLAARSSSESPGNMIVSLSSAGVKIERGEAAETSLRRVFYSRYAARAETLQFSGLLFLVHPGFAYMAGTHRHTPGEKTKYASAG